MPGLARLGPTNARKWLELWDPSVYLPRVKMPLLWVDGTNDQFYPLDSLRKSYLLPRGPRTISMRVRMLHEYEAGEPPEEIHAFADFYLKSGKPLTKIQSVKRAGDEASVKYASAAPIARAELKYTLDSGHWNERVWSATGAQLDPAKRTVRAIIPKGATSVYFDPIDQKDLIVSSDLQILQ